MTTAVEAYGVLRALLEANKPASVSAYRWPNEDEDSLGQVAIPDEPTTFVFAMIEAERAQYIETGGGRGANRHRNPGVLDIVIFVPRGLGLHQSDGSGCLDIADFYVSLLLPFRSGGVTVDSATAAIGGAATELKPPGLSLDLGGYFYAIASIEFTFDRIG